jgi:CubicO group peptidase (beta-lactamase class C family)
MNSEEFRLAQIPALNGHGTAVSIARLMASVPDLLSGDVYRKAVQTHSYGPDEVLKSTTRFGLGFMLHDPESPIGLRPGSFGHAGAGGSMAFYDPNAKLGFVFLMNQMQEGVVTGGTSAMHVARTVYECLEK